MSSIHKRLETAFDELMNNAGKQFDKRVIDIFLKPWTE